jgi:hypothetical protein
MSKLSDLIKRTTRSGPAPMGFAAAPRTAPRTMLTVALIGEHWARSAAEAAEAGADVVLLTGKPGDRDVSEAAAASGDTPCGAPVGDGDPGSLTRLREAKAAFALIDTQSPAGALQEEELGLVLHLRDDLTDIQVRTLEGFPLDAIFLDREQAPLTVRTLIEIQRISGLSRKPLLLPVQPDASQEDLLALRDSGVALLGVDMRERGATEALRGLRGAIEALPQRKKRRDESEALLPRVSSEVEEEDDED